jgi:hypothetical protein
VAGSRFVHMQVMMKRRIALVLVVAALAFPVPARADAGPAVIGMEAGGAVVGGGILGGAAGLALGAAFAGHTGDIEHDIMGWIIGGYLGIAAGLPLGSAIGATAVGAAANQHGRFLASYGLALAGLPVGTVIAVVGQNMGAARIPITVLGCLTPVAGAVLGYNKSRPKESDFGSRLIVVPEVCVRRDREERRYAAAGLGLRFAF